MTDRLCPSRSCTSRAKRSRSSPAASWACAARPCSAWTSRSQNQTCRPLIAAMPEPTPTEMIRASISESGVVSTAAAAVTRDRASAVHLPVITGRTPMMQAASQAQLGQVPPIGPTSGSETTAAAANPTVDRRRAAGLSHGVTRACRTNAWAAENSRMPIAPRTIRSMSGFAPEADRRHDQPHRGVGGQHDEGDDPDPSHLPPHAPMLGARPARPTREMFTVRRCARRRCRLRAVGPTLPA